ncbi:MAG: cytochrome-c peroxidase [Telmatospirillum sp.]|nr:cytochrome-c peroxidase [Telmatospirillum sp.]
MALRDILIVSAALAAVPGLTLAAAPAADEPIQPVEPAKITNARMVDLGKELFFDPRLSKSGVISCNSCHNLAMGGTDNIKTSVGHRWTKGPINAPTVLNAGLNVAQFWDGRAADLKEQAGGPIANPGEMGSSAELAVEVLQTIPAYVRSFKEVFGSEKITIDAVTRAIAAYEETLATPNSRFDKWLKGDKKALTQTELAGYALFKDAGCVSCHNGPNVGGSSFQKMGAVEPYKTTNPAQGRFDVTRNEDDRMMFKVPSLRNIELTYPYFHDGEAATLTEAVTTMGKVQLGRDFTSEETGKIVSFLKTLTGDQPKVVLPVLPPSTDRTPRPEPF